MNSSEKEINFIARSSWKMRPLLCTVHINRYLYMSGEVNPGMERIGEQKVYCPSKSYHNMHSKTEKHRVPLRPGKGNQWAIGVRANFADGVVGWRTQRNADRVKRNKKPPILLRSMTQTKLKHTKNGRIVRAHYVVHESKGTRAHHGRVVVRQQ